MRKGFHCIELAIALVVLALASSLLLAAPGAFGQDYLGTLAGGKRRGEGLKDEAVLRSIHMALAAYGATNKDWFPGLTAAGRYQNQEFQGKFYGAPANAGNAEEAGNGAGCTIDTGNNLAMAALLEDGAVAPKQLLAEGDWDPAMDEIKPGGGKATQVKGNHFSHAMLAYGKPGLKAEWKANQNQQSIVLASRLIFGEKAGRYSSAYTEEGSGKWRGVVVRNDSSVSTENMPGGEGLGVLKYGAKAYQSGSGAAAGIVGIFGAHTDMKNFDAGAKTGMLGSVMDGVKEKKEEK